MLKLKLIKCFKNSIFEFLKRLVEYSNGNKIFE